MNMFSVDNNNFLNYFQADKEKKQSSDGLLSTKTLTTPDNVCMANLIADFSHFVIHDHLLNTFITGGS